MGYDIFIIHKALKLIATNYYTIDTLLKKSEKHCKFKYPIIVSISSTGKSTDEMVRDEYNAISSGSWYLPTVVKTVQNCLESYVDSELKKIPGKKAEDVVKKLLAKVFSDFSKSEKIYESEVMICDYYEERKS